ncbi:MAG: flagellar basal body-associated FliL family protein, partial [Alphaproteobacteria bacterium]|nr:flagellar basal body-associated FliL family protein [Alphaproteobacteria bacterium]
EDAEDTEGEDEDGGQSPGKKFGGKKLILIAGVGVLLLAGAGAGVFFSGILGGDDEEEIAAESGDVEGEEAVSAAADESREAVFYDLPEMLVNLNTGGRQASFLKIQVSLELGNPDAVPQVEAVLPRIVDNFQVYLRELRPEELSGTKGVFRLKEELLVRVNMAVQPLRVYDILFKEILVQG